MDEEYSECFICRNNNTTSVDNGQLNWGTRRRKVSRLENQLDVIFILRNLLKVPRNELELQLREYEGNPEDWIRLCDQCIQLTDKARLLHQEIKLIEKQVLEKIISRVSDEEDDDHGNSRKFQRKIRQLVKQNNHHWTFGDNDDHCRFLEGDKLAKHLVSQRNSPGATALLIVENPMVIPKEDIKMEVESPSSSPSSPHVSPMECSIKPKRRRGRPRIQRDPSKLKLKPCKCLHCGELFSDRLSKQNHVKLVHGTEKRKFVLSRCPHCDKQFTTRKTLHDHVRYVHLKDFKIKCPICDKGFTYNGQKYAHMLANHKDDPLTLKLKEEKGLSVNRCRAGCGSKFLSKDELEKHMERKHFVDKDSKSEKCSRIMEDGKFECGICGRIFQMAKYWSEHQWKSHNVEEVTCPVVECGVVVGRDKGGLEFQGHWNLVHKEKKEKKRKKEGSGPWICKICGVEKFSRSSLSYHLNMVHKVGAKGKPVKCKVKEEKMGEGEEPVLCSLCGKGFSSKGSLYTHMRFVHEKRYTVCCHVCGLKVNSKMGLHFHLLGVHPEDPVSKQLEEKEGFKLSKCEVVGCSAKFLRKEQWDRHVEKMHKGGGGGGGQGNEARFNCKFCGKGFWIRAKLKYHENCHVNRKPGSKLGEGDFKFRCGECGRGYNLKRNLRQHEIHFHNLAKLK